MLGPESPQNDVLNARFGKQRDHVIRQALRLQRAILKPVENAEIVEEQAATRVGGLNNCFADLNR
jgi:hypothetical protein